MFEMRIVELIKMENRGSSHRFEQSQASMRLVQFKLSLMDRFLPSIGEAMITIGLKLKERPHSKLNTEQSNSPNFLIML